MIKTMIAVGTALLLLSSAASAQQRALANACATDIKSVCQGVQPGQGRVATCVRTHFADLSEPCQTAMMKAAAVGKACKTDVKQLCAGTPVGGGQVAACMKSHASEISEPCKGALA